VGAFDGELGIWQNIKDFETAQVWFHAIPSRRKEELGRTEGGGRWDFHISALKNLQPGDKIEYFVEVFDNHPDTAAGRRAPGRSEVWVKTMVTAAEFDVARKEKEAQERKLRELKDKQTNVFK